MVSHGYQLNTEWEDETYSAPLLREWVDGKWPMRARGELAREPTECGWWQQGLTSNFMVHNAWMLHYGLDFTEQDHPYVDMELLWPAHRFSNSQQWQLSAVTAGSSIVTFTTSIPGWGRGGSATCDSSWTARTQLSGRRSGSDPQGRGIVSAWWQ